MNKKIHIANKNFLILNLIQNLKIFICVILSASLISLPVLAYDLDMSVDKEIEQKYGREAYVNMDRLATFMVKMIRKYGSEVLEEIESEEKKKSDIEKRE